MQKYTVLVEMEVQVHRELLMMDYLVVMVQVDWVSNIKEQ